MFSTLIVLTKVVPTMSACSGLRAHKLVELPKKLDHQQLLSAHLSLSGHLLSIVMIRLLIINKREESIVKEKKLEF